MKKKLLLFLLFFGITWTTILKAQCTYGAPAVAATVAAPATPGATITSPTMTDNQVYRVTGIVSGAVYRVYNCGSGFDTQLTIFPSGGGTFEGYNDDNGPECSGAAASINYAPTLAGTKDIKLQRYNCSTIGNSNGTITVRLVSLPASGCTNTSQFPSTSFAAPVAGAGAYTITTCNYQNEYNQMTGAVAGNTFTSTAGIAGTYITVRSGTYNGTSVANGTTPLNWTAAAGGTYFIHYNTDASCGTASSCMTTTITNTTSSGCTNTAQYPSTSFAAPVAGAGAYTITTCNYQNEYNQMTGAVAGNTFTSTAGIAGTYITVRSGTYNGPAVAFGPTPLNWTAVAGGTYFIHYNTNASCGTASSCMVTTITNTSAVVFDPCTSITAANGCGATNTTSIGAGTGVYNPPSATCGFSTPGQEKIYTFTPTVTGLHQIAQSASSGYIDYFFKASSGGCNGTGWTCIDDLSGALSSVAFSLTAGTQYYIMLDPETTIGGSVSFSIVCPVAVPPANDACANAINISSLPYTSAVISNAAATDDVPITICDGPYKNIWWKVTGTCGTMTAITCTGGTNFDNEIAVFTGVCGSMTQVACNDDNGAGCTSNYAGVSWQGTTGVDYYISVGSYYSAGSTGNIQLNVTTTGGTPPTILSATAVSPDVCTGGTTTLNANGVGGDGALVTWWTGMGGTGTNLGTGNSYPGAGPGTYYAYVTGSCTPAAEASVTVTELDATLASVPSTDGNERIADKECSDGTWTHYYQGNQLLLSIKKNGQNIGTVGDGTFEAKVGGTLDPGTGQYASIISNPPALYVEDDQFVVMSRYWNVIPNPEPVADADVRFYFTAADFAAITAVLSAIPADNIPASVSDLYFYKINNLPGPYDPDPANDHAGIPAAGAYNEDGYWEYASGAAATGEEWVLGSATGGNYAEFTVVAFSGGGGGSGGSGGNGAFPIELLYFTGHAETTANIIEWATATEKNNQHQIVERSANGIDDWTEVGRKAGAGNSTTPIAYKMTDAAPLSLGYYRLRAVDFDGTEQLSEVISIQRESDVFTIVNAFPVPVEKEVTLLVNTPFSGDVDIIVTDNSGKLLYKSSTSFSKGINEVKIDMENLPSGTYMVTLDNGTFRTMKQIVK